MESDSSLDFEDYTIAWIAPLEIEAQAAWYMLDRRHQGSFDTNRGDDYIYTAGEINGHNVIIATFPAGHDYGIGSAAALASQVKKSFPNLWFGLLVGVAAGLPDLSRIPPRDIRLGDVLVGIGEGDNAGLVGYGLGKETATGFEVLRHGFQAKTETVVRSAIGNIKTYSPMNGNVFLAYYETMKDQRHSSGTFADPGQDKDQLCQAINITHPEPILRTLRPTSERTRVWYGSIGSGDRFMKNALERDKLRDKFNLIGLEMEAAGIINTIPVGVIRGVCNYGDAQKNKEWQPYAAAVAAAYAKGILYKITPMKNRNRQSDRHQASSGAEKAPESQMVPPKPFRVLPFGRNKDFVGRQSQLDRLIKILYTEDTQEDCQRAALVGLGGVGKTQIALECAFQLQKTLPMLSVFWVRASNITSFDNAYRDIGQQLKIPGLEDDKADAKRLVKTRLSQESTGKWLLIMDNADDFEIFYSDSGNSAAGMLSDYLPFSTLGAILFTTRDREAATRYAGSNVIDVDEMDDTESRQLLQGSLQNKQLIEDKDNTTKLLKSLVNLPLAIMQAAAYMNAKVSTIAQYLAIYEESNDNIIKLLSKDFEDIRRYPDVENPIATTWLISFEQIRVRDPLAADYMAFVSCIKEQHIPQDLLPAASEFKKIEALSTLKAFGFIKERIDGASYDIHRLVHMAMQNWLKLKNEWITWNHKTLNRIEYIFPGPQHENKTTWLIYLPHAYYIVATFNMGLDSTKVAEEALGRLLYKLGQCSDIRGRYAEAEAIYRQTLQLKKAVLGKEHPDTLGSKMGLASSLSDQGKYAEADIIYQQTDLKSDGRQDRLHITTRQKRIAEHDELGPRRSTRIKRNQVDS